MVHVFTDMHHPKTLKKFFNAHYNFKKHKNFLL